MNDEFKETKGFLQNISDGLHVFIRDTMPDGMILVTQILAKTILLLALLFVLNFVFKIMVHFVFKLIKKYSQNLVLRAIYESKVLNMMSVFLAVGVAAKMVSSVFYRHPKSHVFFDTIFGLILVLVFAFLYVRTLKAVERYFFLKGDYARITGIRAVTQTLKIIGIVLCIFIGVSIIFQVTLENIFKSLGAMTALILLIFRDTVLGFITGLHVSASKSVKVGDWIGIPKYDIEGNIEDINLLTTKIRNFDKTVSTVPTYDLLSTEIRNNQVMAEGNRRRIKRAIVFNINSFKFVDEALYQKLESINLLSDYLESKKAEINEMRMGIPYADNIINGPQLTNIGVFRRYVLNYLNQSPNIDRKEVVLVRQLDITPQGMPLEIYCFANKATMKDFEEIQADIFDHLLASTKIFDLEVMQTIGLKN